MSFPLVPMEVTVFFSNELALVDSIRRLRLAVDLFEFLECPPIFHSISISCIFYTPSTLHDLSIRNFDICGFTVVTFVVLNTNLKLVGFCTLISYKGSLARINIVMTPDPSAGYLLGMKIRFDPH
jgi:hypothetical protein